MADNQPKTIDANMHNALIAQLVKQRDNALAECANVGAENTILKSIIQEHNQKADALAQEETKPSKKASG